METIDFTRFIRNYDLEERAKRSLKAIYDVIAESETQYDPGDTIAKIMQPGTSPINTEVYLKDKIKKIDILEMRLDITLEFKDMFKKVAEASGLIVQYTDNEDWRYIAGEFAILYAYGECGKTTNKFDEFVVQSQEELDKFIAERYLEKIRDMMRKQNVKYTRGTQIATLYHTCGTEINLYDIVKKLNDSEGLQEKLNLRIFKEVAEKYGLRVELHDRSPIMAKLYIKDL